MLLGVYARHCGTGEGPPGHSHGIALLGIKSGNGAVSRCGKEQRALRAHAEAQHGCAEAAVLLELARQRQPVAPDAATFSPCVQCPSACAIDSLYGIAVQAPCTDHWQNLPQRRTHADAPPESTANSCSCQALVSGSTKVCCQVLQLDGTSWCRHFTRADYMSSPCCRESQPNCKCPASSL